MTDAQRRFLLVDQCLVGGAINFVLNAAIVWYLFRALEQVPMTGGSQNILGDVVGTFFLLPLILGLIVTGLVRRQVRSGKLAALQWDRTSHPLYRRLPASSFPRALILAIVCTILLGLPLFGLAAALGVTSVPYWDFVVAKGTYSGALAAAVGPVVAYAALGDPGPDEATAAT
ncbi:MAG: hypothetical protein ACODAC_04670 [Pseudomonadota bacterium]